MIKRTIFLAAMTLGTIWASSPAAAVPPAGGSISIEPGRADPDQQALPRSFVGAVSDALAGKGFTILEDSGHAAYVAELIVRRVEVGTGLAKVPAGRGAALPGGGYGSVGAGVVLPLSTGNSEIVPLQRVQLELRLRKRGEEAIVWDGAAVTVRAAGTRKGADDVIASDLSDAILRSYPAQPEGVIGVP